MIKRMIKRDGRVEPYQLDKVSRWAVWASDIESTVKVDWTPIVIKVSNECPEEISTQDFQLKLIDELLSLKSWSAYLMAGRLYIPVIYKTVFGSDSLPTVKEVHQQAIKDGIMIELGYTDEEYDKIQQMIKHELDLKYPHFALDHIRKKYSLKNRKTKKEYETPQFTLMRMAMALASDEKNSDEKLMHVANLYDLYSRRVLSQPTPNYTNLGTIHRGYASCCLIKVGDDSKSLATGDYIANLMTVASAGIGINIETRTVGDGVRNGTILHQGMLPYLKSTASSITANLQNGRGGAGTLFVSGYHPQAQTVLQLGNPRATEDKKNRDLHYALMSNSFLAQKVANNEDIFTFTSKSAPDLVQAFYGPDIKKFKEIYEKYEQDDNFKKEYISAKSIILTSFAEAFETGVSYLANMDEINRHTPFLEPINSSNLCLEICEPTKEYTDVRDLYLEEDHGRGEIALCNLAAIAVDNVRDDADYEKAAYYALYSIDKTIHLAEYPFPHLGYTAKARMNAAVGVMGAATLMARAGVKISEYSGKYFAHKMAEKHAWFLINASLKRSKERGLAPWIHKTKWPQGWTPLKTYNRNIDTVGKFDYKYDWDDLSKRIIENGGIGHSCLIAHMPGEASSKALGGANSLYPIRAKTTIKTDNNIVLRWAAPESDDPTMDYEIAWEIDTLDMIQYYGIWQKFTDQSISADWYRILEKDEIVPEEEIITNYLNMVYYGNKTRYYLNSFTSDGANLDKLQRGMFSEEVITQETKGCAGGACTL